MSVVTLSNVFVDGTTASAGQVNANFNNIVNIINGGIDGSNIADTANLSIATLTTTGNSTIGGTIAVTGISTFKAIAQTVTTYTPAAAATATINVALGNTNVITMPAGNITIAISNETVGQFFVIRIKQDGTGSRTVTWFGGISWDDGSAPTLTTTASKTDTFVFEVTAADTYFGHVAGQNA